MNAWLCGMFGYVVLAGSIAGAVSLLTWNIADPSLTHAASGPTRNLLGPIGAIFSDLVMQLLGLIGVFVVLPPVFWSLEMIGKRRLEGARTRLMLAPVAIALLACAASSLPKVAGWPLPYNLGGLIGDVALRAVTSVLAMIRPERASAAAGLFCFAGGIMLLLTSLGLSQRDLKLIFRRPSGFNFGWVARAWRRLGEMSEHAATTFRREEPTLTVPSPRRSPIMPSLGPMMPVVAPVLSPGHSTGVEYPPHHPAPQQSAPMQAVDDEPDPDFNRIINICAPRGGAMAAAHIEERRVAPPLAPQRPLAQPQPRPVTASADPIGAARRVMATQPPPSRRQEALQPLHPVSQPRVYVEPRQPNRAAETFPNDDETTWQPRSVQGGGDDLYGRAVTIVLGDRKATPDYLQQRLAIGYMRAADLIERMEREGILGAPVYNGMRPILIGGPGSKEI